MDMQPLQASFESQEDAEGVVRKLTALRGDRFRMERPAGGADFGSQSPALEAKQSASANAMLYGGAEMEAAEELGATDSPEDGAHETIHLSADVPAAVFEQAQQVIRQAGGRLL